jgi:hypothetical protein
MVRHIVQVVAVALPVLVVAFVLLYLFTPASAGLLVEVLLIALLISFFPGHQSQRLRADRRRAVLAAGPTGCTGRHADRVGRVVARRTRPVRPWQPGPQAGQETGSVARHPPPRPVSPAVAERLTAIVDA